MPSTHQAKYPVVDPDPTMGRIVSNFNVGDLANVGLFTLAGFSAGWIGARKQLRGPNSKFLAAVGLIAGITYASQNSMQRLLGLEPNDSEVRRFGSVSEEGLAAYKERARQPNLELIKTIQKEK